MEPIDFRPVENLNESRIREEGALRYRSSKPTGIKPSPIKPSRIRPNRPCPKKIAAIAPIMRGVSIKRMDTIEQIAAKSGERPDDWQKPRFGDFEYWLAHRCGWISDEELALDTHSHRERSALALAASHRFSKQRFTWDEKPKYEEPAETNEYIPQVNMKIIKDRNLTDSARRIALFVLRHAYQDNRAGRFIGMTVTFMMKGLSLSRRTVQRSLTLLESRGYFRCEVAHGEETRMCVGLIVHLLNPLFPKHHKEKWPEKRGNRDASSVPQNQTQFKKRIKNAKHRVFRITWALKCMNGVARRAFVNDPIVGKPKNQAVGGLKPVGMLFLHPKVRTMAGGF